MEKKKESREKIPVERLAKGLYVDLELSWADHPFLFSRFKIKSEDDIAVIRQLGLKEVVIIPERSDIEIPDVASGGVAAGTGNVLDGMWQDKKDRIARAGKYRDQRANAAEKYTRQAQTVRKIAQDMKSQPANAIHDADSVVEGLSSEFDQQGEFLTNLVNLGAGEHTSFNHSVNVAVLSLMLGAAEGLKGDDLRQLGVGALLHDIGKIEIPSTILSKIGRLTPTETEILQRHPLLGGKLAGRMQTLPQTSLDIIECHHEFLDGSGYPQHLSRESIFIPVRIVTIANIYDNLCNPRKQADALTPKTALAVMYSKFKNELDTKLVERFIGTIGVYPPGTVVRLNDGSIGVVVAVDPRELLKPELLLYNPDIPKEQALIVDLKEHDELSVHEVLRPGEYPRRVFEYLGIAERIGYVVERCQP